jgi:phosphatidylglycerol:prolipoprotein diacylglycerol transferase
MLCGISLFLYSVIRFWVENYREPDAHIGFIIGSLTIGQLLSIAFIMLGLIIMICSYIFEVKFRIRAKLKRARLKHLGYAAKHD